MLKKLSFKKILAILCVAAGLVMLGLSFYIQEQVGMGQERLDKGKEKLNSSGKALGLFPGNRMVTNQLNSSAKKKIAIGEAQIEYYTTLAQRLMIGGIVLVVIGGVLVYLFRK